MKRFISLILFLVFSACIFGSDLKEVVDYIPLSGESKAKIVTLLVSYPDHTKLSQVDTFLNKIMKTYDVKHANLYPDNCKKRCRESQKTFRKRQYGFN